ncbi:MAG: hypothetical protein ACI93R_003312 [Flavobacteriales bacterium]|jgi:uncharacterized protein (DUF2141 family)
MNIKHACLFFPLCVFFSLFAEAEELGELRVHVKGLKSDDGVVRIALYTGQAQYEEGKALVGLEAEIIDGEATIVVLDLPSGEYAIASFHDEDNDGEHNKNMLGMPTEAYAFSNDATGRFGPAKYEDAKFLYSSTLNVHVLNY